MTDHSHERHTMRPDEPYGEKAGLWIQPEEAERDATSGTFAPAFYDIASLPRLQPAPGVEMSIMVGGAMMANWVRIDPGAGVPLHAHIHEQMGLVLEGEIEMTIAGETRVCRPGEAYTIPGDVPHSGKAGPDGCLVLDIFSPPREDYIEQTRARG